MKTTKKFFILFLAIFISVLSFNCNSKNKTEQNSNKNSVAITPEGYIKFTPQQAKVANIKTDTLKLIKLATAINATGSVEASPGNKFDISAPIAGYITKIFINHGAVVKKGQPLLTLKNLDLIDIQTQYLKTKAQLQYLQDQYKRQQQLLKNNAISLKSFLQTKTEYLTAKTELNSLRLKLKLIGIDPNSLSPDNIKDQLTLYSPTNGIVGEINANIGTYVEPNDIIMIITNPSGYQIMLNVYGIYHYIIKKGQKVIFNLAQNPKTFYATVTSITPVINPETETFYVHAKPIKNYKELTEGAYVSAQILSNNQKVYAIEKNAVVTNNSEKFVYIQVKPFTYKKVIVQTALENDKYIQIVNFKKLLGKKIVISGANYIFAKEQFLND